MTGKVAVITGASEGIGAGLVAGYRGRGWAVVASAATLKPSKNPEVLNVEGDIADPASADRVIGGALERFGRLDTLVNNAGVVISKPFTDYTAADYALVAVPANVCPCSRLPGMPRRVRVREIEPDEGQRLLRIVRRSSGSVVTWRRAQMVLLSAQGLDMARIAEVTFTSIWRNCHADDRRLRAIVDRANVA